MASNTTRFGLNTYSAGDTGWDHTDVVNHVDEHSIGRDTVANRPASGDYDNQLFFATDERLLYRWDAGTSSWVTVGGRGASGAPLPAIHVTTPVIGGHTEYTGGAHGPAVVTAENLAGKTGNADGEIRMDDGTNTVARMTACVWDDVNAVWRPVNDPSAGAFA